MSNVKFGSARSSKLLKRSQVSEQDAYLKYSGVNWTVFRAKKEEHRTKLASGMYLLCKNDNILYSQNKRGELLSAFKGSISAINKTVHCDCSSAVRVIIYFATGKLLGNFTTSTEKKTLDGSGLFEKPFVCTSLSQLRKGDILVARTSGEKAHGHTVIVTEAHEEKTTSEDRITKLANEVIAGKYGNGLTRKKKLGSDYKKVQEKVNHLLKTKKK